MRSVEDMAQECLLKLLPSYTANELRAPERENLVYVCIELAKELHAELSKLNRGVPEAILEAEAEQLKAQLLCCQQENQGLVERVNRLEREKWEVLRGGDQKASRGEHD